MRSKSSWFKMSFKDGEIFEDIYFLLFYSKLNVYFKFCNYSDKINLHLLTFNWPFKNSSLFLSACCCDRSCCCVTSCCSWQCCDTCGCCLKTGVTLSEFLKSGWSKSRKRRNPDGWQFGFQTTVSIWKLERPSCPKSRRISML